MEYNWRQIEVYTQMFSAGDSLNIGDALNGNIALDRNNVFSKLCVIDLTGDTIEIPVFAKTVVEDTIINSSSTTKVVLPLYSNSNTYNRRTADSIIRSFFMRGNLTERLQKVVTNKNEVYYGMRGIILDEHFNPLIMATISLDRESKMYKKVTIYIHPEVFLNTNGLIHKSIIKKIIPFYISYNEDLSYRGRRAYYRVESSVRPQVVIEDAAKKFIQSPNRPSPQSCTDDKLNQLMIENIDEILNQIR